MKPSHWRMRRPQHGSLSELNITPLLDLVFVLLVIFIITTPQLTNSLEINLPSGKPQTPANQPKPTLNRIFISAEGHTELNKQQISHQSLKNVLQRIKNEQADLKIVVEASDEAEYQNVVNVFDLLQQLDIRNVGLVTAR